MNFTVLYTNHSHSLSLSYTDAHKLYKNIYISVISLASSSAKPELFGPGLKSNNLPPLLYNFLFPFLSNVTTQFTNTTYPIFQL